MSEQEYDWDKGLEELTSTPSHQSEVVPEKNPHKVPKIYIVYPPGQRWQYAWQNPEGEWQYSITPPKFPKPEYEGLPKVTSKKNWGLIALGVLAGLFVTNQVVKKSTRTMDQWNPQRYTRPQRPYVDWGSSPNQGYYGYGVPYGYGGPYGGDFYAPVPQAYPGQYHNFNGAPFGNLY
jgi:hypothetical protein